MKPAHVPSALFFAAVTILARSAAAAPTPTSLPTGEGAAVADRPPETAPAREWEDTDHVRVGALLGLGFPRPLSIQGLVKIERAVSLGFEYGMMPTLRVSGVEGSLWGVAADARVFPFRGAFFIGLRAGYQRMRATASIALDALGNLAESATAETWFLNPRAGFLWTFRPGLTVGLDAGVQLPVSKTFASTLPEWLPTDVGSTLRGVADAFGHDVTPTVDLVRIGVLL